MSTEYEFFNNSFFALAMSTDTFAVAVCKGTTLNVPRFFDALKIGILFGLVEAATPVFWGATGLYGDSIYRTVEYWVIFTLMLILGTRMIYGSTQGDECDDSRDKITDDSAQNNAPDIDNLPQKTELVLFIAAVSTSIDAFVVGASLALVNVNICFVATIIGLATCIMVTIGILLGKKIDCHVGKKAEFLGGVLILIGMVTLYQHLSA